MFAINHYYSHSLILSQASGYEEPQRIRGEIQHSFWQLDKDLSKFRPSKFSRKLFLWGGSFMVEKRQQLLQLGFKVIPIGDPFLYFLKIHSIEPSVAKYDLFLPKFSSHAQIQDRVMSHESALNELVNLSCVSLKVRLHHKDYASPLIQNLYKKRGIDILHGGEPSSLSWMEEYANHLNTCGTIYSDHLGSHILRATVLGVKCQLLKSSLMKSNLESVFELYSAAGNPSDQNDFARFQLGFQYMRSQEELRTELELKKPRSLINKTFIFLLSDLNNKIKSI